MPARQVSNEIAARELYAAPDGKRPDYQQILYAAKKTPRLFSVTKAGAFDSSLCLTSCPAGTNRGAGLRPHRQSTDYRDFVNRELPIYERSCASKAVFVSRREARASLRRAQRRRSRRLTARRLIT